MMATKLLLIELTKLKRSQALLMTFLCPLSIVGLQFLMVLERGGRVVAEKGWISYWYGVTNLWYMLMLPLFVALITTLINATEHRSNGWRFMATMPVKRWQLFVVKAFISWLCIGFAVALMYLFASASILCLILIGYEATTPFSAPFVFDLPKVMLSIVPIVVIGHIVSWLFSSIVLPLVIGITMTVIAVTVANSTYWLYDPWTYHLAVTLFSYDDSSNLASIWGGVFGLTLLSVGATILNKRDIVD
ncbi:ABC transporter permease [Agaribacter marinus]|uniref:ABC-2 family transporter protein n=1 Tax=Agaribacter marinus TaxID=1431249 RepID=A0AA37WKD6_9ALTE|nr:ABC transporter permease [Agaribacter marinus]GLR73008.1 hypothetical protein GCM10007852_39160 [Agaribacter marinus]